MIKAESLVTVHTHTHTVLLLNKIRKAINVFVIKLQLRYVVLNI